MQRVLPLFAGRETGGVGDQRPQRSPYEELYEEDGRDTCLLTFSELPLSANGCDFCN